MYQLGEVLHKTLAEIAAMTVAEYHGWIAHFNAKAKKSKR